MSEQDQNALLRRDLLRVLPAGVAFASAVQGQHCSEPAKASSSAPYQFTFFNPDEVRLLDLLTDKIIPADEHSPGARQARVVEFADLMISGAAPYKREDWRTALRLVTEDLKTKSVEEWLDTASAHETDPQTVTEVFFRDLKHMTINGYYTSAIGIHDDLHYQGNTYVAEFKGCDHAEHIG